MGTSRSQVNPKTCSLEQGNNKQVTHSWRKLYAFHQLMEFSGQRTQFECRRKFMPERGGTPKRLANTHTRMLLMKISDQASLRISTSSQKK
jgi:hypothetical protein